MSKIIPLNYLPREEQGQVKELVKLLGNNNSLRVHLDGCSYNTTLQDGILTLVESQGITEETMTIDIVKNSNLVNAYGKLDPQLTFINNMGYMSWLDTTGEEFGLPKGNYKYILGNYRISQRGTKIFDCDFYNYNHIIIAYVGKIKHSNLPLYTHSVGDNAEMCYEIYKI